MGGSGESVAFPSTCPSVGPAARLARGLSGPWVGGGKSLTCGALAGQQRPEAQQDAQSGHRSRGLLQGKRAAPGARGSWDSPARSEGRPG